MAHPHAVDAIVVGTGFGGAVTACRLAQAGVDVTVLERGHRYPAGSFPRDTSTLDGWLWGHDGGLFDLRPASDVMVVQAAGYGGGSLIYANVHYRPPDDVFDPQHWLRDQGFSRDGLAEYYDLVAYMLDIGPISPSQPKTLPPKTLLMEQAAATLGRSGQSFRPNLAVNFGPPGTWADNKFGRAQSGCSHCAECDIGCNTAAKNTLDLNYLALAEQHGATVRCDTEVQRLEKVDDVFRVHVRHADAGPQVVSARRVFLCAGALGSTELLLRSRDSLPALSESLGRRYSGNGDFLAFGFDTAEDKAFEPLTGPTITTACVYDDRSSSQRRWFVLEDGGYPRQLVEVLQLLNPAEGIGADVRVLREALGHRGDAARAARETLAESGHSAVFLAMGRDHADGVIDLVPGTDSAHVHWSSVADLGLYGTESALCHDYVDALGGEYVENPAWRILRQPVSVHNLGGCPMGASPAEGVVGPDGGVHNCAGLYVIDGAILPTATGANPSHTIAAVAELCVERAIRSITGDEDWRAPEHKHAGPVDLPEDRVTIPPDGTARPATRTRGLAFTESMRGALTAVPTADGVPSVPSWAGEFTVTISTPNLDDFLSDPLHPASADGTVTVEGLTPPEGAPILGGRFNLLVDADRLYRRQMLYTLPFHVADGRRLILSGRKEVWDHGRFDVWPATTTLYVDLLDAESAHLAVVASGVLTLDVRMFARQLTTVRVTGTRSPLRQALGLAAFGRFFGSSLVDVFLRSRVDR